MPLWNKESEGSESGSSSGPAIPEGALARLIATHYRRAQLEGRTLVHHPCVELEVSAAEAARSLMIVSLTSSGAN